MLSLRDKSGAILIIPILILPIICLSAITAFADGHGDTGELEYRVDTEDLSGLNLLLANLYNDQRVVFAIVATLTMAILGAVIAVTTEYLLKLVGFKTTKAERRE